eukprot:645106_1
MFPPYHHTIPLIIPGSQNTSTAASKLGSPRCNIAVYLATIFEFPTTQNVCSVIILLIALDLLLLSHDSHPVVFDPIVLVSNTLLLYLFVDVVCVKMGSNAYTNASLSNAYAGASTNSNPLGLMSF